MTHKPDSAEIINSSEIPDSVRLNLLGYQNEVSNLPYKKGLCQNDFYPGTFTLAEISQDAPFLKEKLTFNEWLDEVLEQELSLLESIYPGLFKNKSSKNIKLGVEKILSMRTEQGKSLKDEIWFQEYSDVLRRIIFFLLGHSPDIEVELYPNLTYKRKKLAFSVMNWIEKNNKPELWDWLSVSVAAGLMGVDEKSNHAATSAIVRTHVIPLDKNDKNYDQNVVQIGELLWDVAHTNTRIDATSAFKNTLEREGERSFYIVSFPDDYIETIFLLKYYACLLQTYPHVEIDCIPRSIRCGNDATYKDIHNFLEKYPYLQASNRFRVHNEGPKLGTVNLLKLHNSIFNLIEKADIVDARGARNYEMLQGINKEVYFGFMVCRDFSESTTGMFAEDRPLIFIKQLPKERSFRDFRMRGNRIKKGRMLCPVTVYDNKEKWEGK
jgi:hypothetical protein